MKKLFSIFALTLGCMALVSCGSDDDYTEKVNSVTVVNANTTIDFEGGPATIVVTGEGISASTDASWLTVSVNGNTVTATAQKNESRESRSTHVTVKAANGDYTLVPIQQYGWKFDTSIFSLTVGDDAQEAEFTVSSAYPVTVSSESTWFTTAYDANTGKVTVNLQANDTGLPRTGNVTVESEGTVKSIPIYQADFQKDVLGTYKFGYSTSSGNQNATRTFDATLTSKNIIITVSSTQQFKIPITFPNGTEAPYVIKVSNEQYVGDYNGNYCFVAFDNSDYNFLGRYANYFFEDMSASLVMSTLQVLADDQGASTGMECIFEGAIDLDGYNYGEVKCWYILAMSDETYSQNNYVRRLYTWYWPRITKVVS